MFKTGLEVEGPGQEVMLQGLRSKPGLNGQKGRVLPLSGPGAPPAAPAVGRVAVRLARDSQVVSCKKENLISPYAVSAGSRAPATSAAAGGSGAGRSGSSGRATATTATAGAAQQQQLPRPTGRLADLITADVERGEMPPRLTRSSLREAGLSEALIKCCACGDGGQEKYMALARTAPASNQPLPKSALRLECIDCLIRAAQAAGVAANAEAVGEFVDGRTMGAFEACSLMMGFPTAQWGSQGVGSGAMY